MCVVNVAASPPAKAFSARMRCMSRVDEIVRGEYGPQLPVSRSTSPALHPRRHSRIHDIIDRIHHRDTSSVVIGIERDQLGGILVFLTVVDPSPPCCSSASPTSKPGRSSMSALFPPAAVSTALRISCCRGGINCRKCT